MRYIISLALTIAITAGASAESIITGKITDSGTNEPLAYVNIYVEGTYIGTISNDDGEYYLKIPVIPANVIISHLGYKTGSLTIEKPGDIKADISLTPFHLQLEEVVVTAKDENPALRIMREVIKKKQEFRKRMKSYKARAYTRLRIEKDDVIVSMAESVSKVYWDREEGAHEDFVAVKNSKQLTYLTDMDVGASNVTDLYNDKVELINTGFITPTHPKALNYYDFKIAGRQYLNDQLVYHIEVKPKSKLQPLFLGRISILYEEFAMIAADLETPDDYHFHEMLKNFKGKYSQKFSDYGAEFWLLTDSQVEESIELDMGLLAFPEGTARKTIVISGYMINTNVKDDIARISTANESAETAARKLAVGEEFEGFEIVPLTPAEKKLYDHPDTTLTMINTFRPRGLMAPFLISKEDDIEEAMRTTREYAPIDIRPKIKPRGWYNRVEGLNVGISYKMLFRERLDVSAVGGYRTYMERVYYSGRLAYLLQKSERNKNVFIEYFDKTDTRYKSDVYSQTVMSLLPLFGEGDYFDYYNRRGFSAGIEYGVDKLKTTLSLALKSENNYSIGKKSNCSFFNTGYRQRINPAIAEGTMNSVLFRLDLDQAYFADFFEKTFGRSLKNRFIFEIEHSSPDYMDSDFDFTYYNLRVDLTLKTFFRNRSDYNYLRTRFVAGTYEGDLPPQRYMALDGSFYGYTPFGIFRTSYNRPVTGEKRLAFFWEHSFTSIPFEILGLDYCANNKYEFYLNGALGRTWIDGYDETGHSVYSPHYYREYQGEIGASMKFKFRFIGIRLDGTRNLNNSHYYLGFNLKMISLSF